jgi:Na+-transporting NADH:ubiquinone oxidoreductase subunit C
VSDSNAKTMGFATGMTIVCAIILGVAATALKPLQEQNAKVFKLQNIVNVFGLEAKTPSEVEAYFSEAGKDGKLVVRFIKDHTGADVEMTELEYKNLDLYKQEKLSVDKRRYPYFVLYNSKEDKVADKAAAIALPTQDFGLWSVCYGYLALDADAITVKGIIFYDQKETPGLGAEIEQDYFRNTFVGKKLVNEKGEEVGLTPSKDMEIATNDPHSFLSVSGATFTINGVDNGLKTTLENYKAVLEHYRKGDK